MAFLEAKNSIIFAKIFVIFLRLRKIENSEFSEHYKKMTLKLNFKNRKKLVPTEHSSSSSECRALILGSLKGSKPCPL